MASLRGFACLGGTRRVSVVLGEFRWVSEGLSISKGLSGSCRAPMGLGGSEWDVAGIKRSKQVSMGFGRCQKVLTDLSMFWWVS